MSQRTFLETFEEVQTLYPEIRIEYASFLDIGSDNQHMQIEQFRSNGIAHSKYSRKIQRIDFFNADQIYSEHPTELQNALLFDERSGKIFFKGKNLDSKIIPSQKSTSELMITLLKAKGFRTTNEELPHSSYRKNKSEMTSKILIPLTKFLKQQNEELILNCRGSITAFELEFISASLPVGVITR